MPPFINTNCTHCGTPNRFDLAELRKKDGSLVKGVFNLRDKDSDKDDEVFEETCRHCGRKFKFPVKGGDDGKKK